jgi:predicted enzyme related to lactoylglutathione lyase
MPRVVHFEIDAHEPERATRFYNDVFGWSIQKWDGPMEYWLIKTGEDGEMGINGGLSKRSPDEPVKTVNTIGVESVDATLEKITAAGGTVAMPKMAVPGVGYLAYCVDTEGNTFGIMQPDTSAQG